MRLEIPKNKELSPRQKAKLEFAENLVPEVAKLRKATGISMTAAIVEVLKRKGITAKEDIEYCKKVIPSLSGARGAWVKEKQKVEEIEDQLRYEELKSREEKKGKKELDRKAEKEKQLDLFK